MSLKKGGGPSTLPTTLTVVGQGSTDKLNITYHNRRNSEVEAKLKEDEMTFGKAVPYLVESWDTDFALTEEGVAEFEDEYPGIVDIVIAGFWKARRKDVEKN